ncbi:hypothetical protein BDV12DRAFT_177977 [Aspergillus spectabilis]
MPSSSVCPRRHTKGSRAFTFARALIRLLRASTCPLSAAILRGVPHSCALMLGSASCSRRISTSSRLLLLAAKWRAVEFMLFVSLTPAPWERRRLMIGRLPRSALRRRAVAALSVGEVEGRLGFAPVVRMRRTAFWYSAYVAESRMV